jgi:hypothetical protein
LTVKPADKTDAAGQARRLWKLDRFNALSDAERNAVTADATTIRRSKNSPRFLLLRLQLFNECSEVRRHRCREGIVLVPQSFFGRTARTEISDCQRKMSF